MSKKKKRILYAIIIFVAILLFIFFLLFFGNNEKYDFIPAIIGSGSVFAIYFVKHSKSKVVEWTVEKDKDKTDE